MHKYEVKYKINFCSYDFFKSRSIIFLVNSFGYNSCSELLSVTLAALAIALLPKAVLALQQVNIKHLQFLKMVPRAFCNNC